MTTILLLGKNGQVGWELQRALAPLGRIVAMSRAECDLADGAGLRTVIRETRPAMIVNAAAYTAVDKAESEPELCRAINGIAPGILAEEAKALGAWLVHYSTDYVFDGTRSGYYQEHDAPSPLSIYGVTKLEGEHAIQQSGCRHFIFRTSWVFGTRGGNFAKTILRLAKEREQLKIVGDQFGAPTSAELIADVTALCLHDVMASLGKEGQVQRQGLYHLAAAGETSWHEYARFVLSRAEEQGSALKCTADRVEAIPASAYPLPARRPLNSRLDTTKLRRELGIHLPDWTDHVRRMVAETLAGEAA
jgi:dTDP-4-dehydrorhamnose reductase